MQDDPIQGILFNSNTKITFRDPLTRSEKVIDTVKKAGVIVKKQITRTTEYKPSFSTNLLPMQNTIRTTVSGPSTTRKITPQ